MTNILRCSICGNEKPMAIISIKDFHIVKCRKCGFAWLTPQPSSHQLESLYTQNYYNSWGLNKEEDFQDVREMKRKTFNRWLNEIEKYIKFGKILDIGCAMGFFLEVAKEKGWEIFGVEQSEYAAKLAKKELGNRIYCGTLEKAGFDDSSFDVVTVIDLLEHVKDLLHFLQEIYRIMKPNGILTISTPNINSLTARLMGPHWFHFKLEHLYYFSPKTMSKLLSKSRFKLVEIIPALKTLNFLYLHSQFTVYTTPFFTQLTSILKHILPLKIKKISFPFIGGEMFVIARKI